MSEKYRSYWECKIKNDVEYDNDGHTSVEYTWIFGQLIWQHYWGDKLDPKAFSIRYDPNYDQPDLMYDDQFRSFILLRKSEKCGTLSDAADIYFAYTVREHRNKGIITALLDKVYKKYKKVSVKVPIERKDFWIRRGFKEVSNWIDINDKVTVFLDKYNY